MTWSNTELRAWQDIEKWIHSFQDYEENDFQNIYGKWMDYAISSIPTRLTEPFFEKLDSWMFHFHSLLQGLQIQDDAKNRIINSAKVFDETINSIQDMQKLSIDKLSYIADQHVSRHKLYSLLQGGISGTGQPLFLSTDFLALLIINLRSVQLTAMTYGYDVRNPFEMMSSLRVFQSALLPRRLKALGWNELTGDLQAGQSYYFYEGAEKLTDFKYLEEPFKQLAKLFFIVYFNKKASGMPILSLALGAGANYKFSRKVNQFAEKYYQYRYLLDRQEEE